MAFMLKNFTLATQMVERAGAGRVLGAKGLEMYSFLSQEDKYRGLNVRAICRYIGGREDTEHRQDGTNEVARNPKQNGNSSNGY